MLLRIVTLNFAAILILLYFQNCTPLSSLSGEKSNLSIHSLKNIPYIFAGQAGGKFATGKIVDAKNRSNNDLLVSIQQACGINSNTFGKANLCTGPII